MVGPIDVTLVTSKSVNIRREALYRAIARIRDGEDWEDVLDRLLDGDGRSEFFRKSLGLRSVEKGAKFELEVETAIVPPLHAVIEVPMIGRQVPCLSGRIDLVLPLKVGDLPTRSFTNYLAQRYQAHSVVVESKNEENPVGVSAVNQVHGYLQHGPFGKLGFLASNRGFAKPAMDLMRDIARAGTHLILPFDQRSLSWLRELRGKDVRKQAERHLRRKLHLLCQGKDAMDLRLIES